MPNRIALNCLVLGDPIGRSVVIDIAATADVERLLKAIKKAYSKDIFKRFSAMDIVPWKVSIPRNEIAEAIIASLRNLNDEDSLVAKAYGNVSDIFSNLQQEGENVHILVKPPKFKLVGYISGDDATMTFDIEIGTNLKVSALLKAVKTHLGKRFKKGTNLEFLKVWKADIPIVDGRVSDTDPNHLDNNNLIFAAMLLWDVFKHSLTANNRINFVVRSPSEDIRSPGGTSQLSSKETSPAPSSLGSFRKFREFQKQENFKEQGYNYPRPVEREHRLPLTLLDPLFAEFVHNFQLVKPTEIAYECALKLRQRMNDFYDKETERAEVIREILNKLGFNIQPGQVHHNPNGSKFSYRSDGHIDISGSPVIVLEVKNEFSAAHTEPILQAVLYFDYMVKGIKNLSQSLYPCIILTVVGPNITFSGAAFTDRSALETFSSIPLDFHSSSEEAFTSLAKHLTALKMAHESLKELHKPNVLMPNPSTRAQRSSRSRSVGSPLAGQPRASVPETERGRFPYPTSYQPLGSTVSTVETTFKYVETLPESSTALGFMGQTTDSHAPNLIIKFVRRYGTNVHRWLEEKGLAPKLLGMKKLPGGWIMVVMELLSELKWRNLHDYTRLRGVFDRSGLVKVIHEALEDLHNNGMVHGDIRDVNIMVDIRQEIPTIMKFIDFDWAGSVGEVTYPPFVNKASDLKRPEAVSYGVDIVPAHDMHMCNNLL
ncbi:hypothetical protein BDQ17DRAFT_1542161 [Cyathus striatus]|nr:hypothetical protein BDQ17DRAFT_1542161 [Cyathus striatus]